MTAATGMENGRVGWRVVLGEMIDGTAAAVQRFPVATVLLLLMALSANLEISGIALFPFLSSDHAIALGAAALAALAVSLYFEGFDQARAIGQGLALTISAFVFALLEWPDVFETYALALIPSVAGLVILAPFAGRGSDIGWLFAVRLAFAALLSVLVLVLFAGGVSAILATLSYLFGLPVPEDLYGHIWVSVGLFAAPLFGLGQIPRADAPGEPEAPPFVTKGMRILGDFAAAPLLTIYAVILHVYALKIVLTGNVPEGQVGWIVLAFGLCVFAVLLVVHPYLTLVRAPTRLLKRWWAVMLPAPLALLFYAAFVRIGEYGVTPERYLLVLFGIVSAVLAGIQLLPRCRGNIRLIALLPVVALFLASFGPQGAVATSLRSQAGRFAALVAEQPLSWDERQQAISALRLLENHDALERVPPETIPAELGQWQNRHRAAQDGSGTATNGRTQLARNFAPPDAIDAAGFDVVLPEIHLASTSGEPVARLLPNGTRIELALEGDAILIAHGTTVTRFPLPGDLAEAVSYDEDENPQWTVEADGKRLMVEARYLNGSVDRRDEAGQPILLDALGGTLFLNSADWAGE